MPDGINPDPRIPGKPLGRVVDWARFRLVSGHLFRVLVGQVLAQLAAAGQVVRPGKPGDDVRGRRDRERRLGRRLRHVPRPAAHPQRPGTDRVDDLAELEERLRPGWPWLAAGEHRRDEMVGDELGDWPQKEILALRPVPARDADHQRAEPPARPVLRLHPAKRLGHPGLVPAQRRRGLRNLERRHRPRRQAVLGPVSAPGARRQRPSQDQTPRGVRENKTTGFGV